ncbi:MAG TPA: hypothetical protein VD902_16590 [Symbiobacteriaceae bacterium]|nr:hypothetical protein [Symbiobacteriaceae bacterium]
MAGIPTVLITTDRESSEQQRPPRAIAPEGFKWGHSLGTAANQSLQREVLTAALQQTVELHMPGKVRVLAFSGYDPLAL